MKENLLEVKGLKKYFPIYAGLFRHHIGDIKAIDGIDFSIPKGKVLGMLGESGSGKSTAARAAIRLIEPTAGEIYFEGQSLLALSYQDLKKLRKDISNSLEDDPIALLRAGPNKSLAVAFPFI